MTDNVLDRAGEARLYRALRRFWHAVGACMRIPASHGTNIPTRLLFVASCPLSAKETRNVTWNARNHDLDASRDQAFRRWLGEIAASAEPA